MYLFRAPAPQKMGGVPFSFIPLKPSKLGYLQKTTHPYKELANEQTRMRIVFRSSVQVSAKLAKQEWGGQRARHAPKLCRYALDTHASVSLSIKDVNFSHECGIQLYRQTANPTMPKHETTNRATRLARNPKSIRSPKNHGTRWERDMCQ